MRIGITTSATFKSKTYVAGATKANMSGDSLCINNVSQN